MVPLCQHCLGRTMFSTMREYSVSVIQKVFVCLVLFGVVLLVLFGLFVCLFVVFCFLKFSSFDLLLKQQVFVGDIYGFSAEPSMVTDFEKNNHQFWSHKGGGGDSPNLPQGSPIFPSRILTLPLDTHPLRTLKNPPKKAFGPPKNTKNKRPICSMGLVYLPT